MEVREVLPVLLLAWLLLWAMLVRITQALSLVRVGVVHGHN